MTQTFKPGDTVALKSGGAAMVVDQDGAADEDVHCIWIDEVGNGHGERIAIACLAHITRKCVVIDGGMHRYIWVFADSGFPLMDHIATAERIAGEPA